MKFTVIFFLAGMLTACTAGKSPIDATTNPALKGAIGTMRLIQTLPLQNVEGRIDHLSIDLTGQRLFVAALGNNTVEILDLATGNLIHTISGLNEPQGVLYLPGLNKLYVTSGGSGLCDVFDGSSFASKGQLDLSGDADNIRYAGSTKMVVAGYGNGGLSLIDASTDKIISSIKLDGHPESFQLDTSGTRIFVNIPTANQIAVVDSQKQAVIATWLLTDGVANFPMALDEKGQRLFVGFRVPARLGVYDTETGKLVASLESVGDVDDIFYDASHKLLFVIGGEGFIDVFSQQDADHYKLLTRTATASGARTGLWVPELNRLYVAVPHNGSQAAEIRVYEFQPALP